MDRLQGFREEALNRGIPADDVERWMQTARPCVTLESGPGPQIAGQLGGHPLLPLDVPHPELPFVGSLDCAALPAGTTDLDLPPDGTLLYFADPEPDGSASLIYVPAGTPVAEQPAPEEWIPVFEHSEAHAVIDLTLPNRAKPSDEHPHAEALAGVWWDIGHKLVQGHGPLQIGGFPWSEQERTFEVAAEHGGTEPGGDGERPEDWALIGTWTPDDDEYDHAYVHMLIRRTDLAARNFDRVFFHWEMAG